jgi:hypothetical protein
MIFDIAEKPTTRAKYDEAANKLKYLYAQQKALQEEIKSTFGKGKKRATTDGNSRRSPRKKARGSDNDVSTITC